MAQALKTLIKAFCKQFADIDEYEVLTTYDPSIRSREAASRQYYKKPDIVLRHAMDSLAKAGIRYESFAEMVRNRTKDGHAPVMQALETDARKVAQELEESSQLYNEIDLWRYLKCGFLCNEAFRKDFNRALQEDGLTYSRRGLWNYVDEKMAALNGVLADDVEAVTEAQCTSLAACVYASLTDSTNIRQDMGEPLEQTPIMHVYHTGTHKQGTGQSTTAQLQEITFFGSDTSSWSAHTEDARESGTLFAPLHRFTAEQGARIGREDYAWCSSGGRVPVVTSAEYVSRHQCEIFYKDGQWFIADVGPDGAGSTNGTLITPANPHAPSAILNGETHPLKHGDLICINPYRLQSGNYSAENHTWATNETGENYRFELVPETTRAHKTRSA